jgi:uncharacterized membrane protein
MNITTIFLFACFYMVLPLAYFMLRNESKPKKNIILGVTLPYDARQEEEVLAICAAFRRHLTITCLVLTVLSLGALLQPAMSLVMVWLLTWLLLAMAGPFLSFTIYHRKLKRLKAGRQWFSLAEGKLMLDTSVSFKSPGNLKGWLFAPAFFLSLVPIAVELFRQGDWAMNLFYCINAILVASFYLFYLVLYRQKAEIIDRDTSLSMALTRVRRYNWGKFWIVISWVTALYNLGSWLFVRNSNGILITTALYTVVVVIASIQTEFGTRKAQEKLTDASGKDLYLDDDQYWINGMFYHNPHDKHLIINARVGINTTINLARPAGKVLMAATLLMIIAMPFIGVWLVSEEFTPITLEMTVSALDVQHTSLVYSVPLADIQQVELLEVLPHTTRTYGTGMDTLLKGRFRVEGVGSVSLCLNPKVPPFILIRTQDRAYIFGEADGAATRRTYALLLGRL